MKINYSEETAEIKINDAVFHFKNLTSMTSVELSLGLRKQFDNPTILPMKLKKFLDRIDNLYTEDGKPVPPEDVFKLPRELIEELYLRLIAVVAKKGNRLVDPIEAAEKNESAQ